MSSKQKFVPGLIRRPERISRLLSASLAKGTYAPPVLIDLRTQLLPSSNQGHTPMCFPGDTKVLMEDLTWRNIRSISKGERVISDDGQPHVVTHVHKRLYNGRLKKIGLESSLPLVCTPEHPILASSPKGNVGYYPASKIKKGWAIASFGVNCRHIEQCIYSFEYDHEFQTICGFYLATGHLEPDDTVVLVLKNSIRRLDKFVCLYAKQKGWKFKVIQQKDAVTVRIFSLQFYKWIKEHFHSDSSIKQISNRLLLIQPTKLNRIIQGWQDAQWTEYILSETTARSLKLMALKAGRTCIIKKLKAGFLIHLDQGKGFWKAGYYFDPVTTTSLSKKETRYPVFNLTVAERHTYVADFSIVHNCAAYAMAGWLEFYNWKYKGIVAQIEPLPIYRRAKQIDGYPSQDGTTLEAVLQAVQDLGLLTGIQGVREIKAEDARQALHRYGVIIAAFDIDEGWLNAKPDGWIENKGNYLGLHAVLLCGYSMLTSHWYAFQNSWGDTYGWKGFNRISEDAFKKSFVYGLVWQPPT